MRIIKIILCLAVWLCTAPPALAIVYPQVALGGGYETLLIVTNMSNASGGVQLYLQQGAFQRWAGSWSVNGTTATGQEFVSFSLGPKETKKLVLRGDSQIRSGWLELRSCDSVGNCYEPSVATSLFYNFYSSAGLLLDSTATPPSEPHNRFMFNVERTSVINTGLAIAAGQLGFQLRFILNDAQGNPIGIKSQTYNGQMALFVDQLFSGVPQTLLGSVEVEADIAIHLVVLRFETTPQGFQSTSVPAVPKPQL